jgi:hypothetical protein
MSRTLTRTVPVGDPAEAYRRHYQRLGRPLTGSHSLGESAINAAERRLGVRLPTALRTYYRVAGRERRLNHAHNRLLAPADWIADGDRVVFLEENQAVVAWGTRVRPTGSRRPDVSDPPVFQCQTTDVGRKWFREHRHVSVFLIVHLYWQAVLGGLPYTRSAPAARGLQRALDAGWDFVGEVNYLRAYSQAGQALCLLPWDGGRRVFAAALTAGLLESTRASLDLHWD